MIAMNDCQESNQDKVSSALLGFGLIKLLGITDKSQFEVIFIKGMNYSLIQNVIELCKEEIIEKKEGNLIIPIEDYLLSLQYFMDKNNSIIVSIFMDEKEKGMNYVKVYLIFKKLKKLFQSYESFKDIKNFCQNNIEILQTKDIKALVILDPAGSPFYSRLESLKGNAAQSEVFIGGFISAMFSFTKEVIGKDASSSLKEIKFSDKTFYLIVKDKVIFTFLVEKLTPLLKNYMYIIVDEFLNEFQEDLKKFNGNISPFKRFDRIINQYCIF